ncbi:MAG: hypothetical protein ACFFDT_05910 [Candidatus Hodarchaeota archaeon]
MKRKTLPLTIIALILLMGVTYADGQGEEKVWKTQPTSKTSAFTDWKSMISKIKSNLEYLPTYDTYPEPATSWTEYADNTFEELLLEDLCWFTKPYSNFEIVGYRPYVKGADGWGAPTWERDHTELMAEMDVLWPMYRYLQINPNSTRQTMVNDFIDELPKYYWNKYKQSTNQPNETRHDSWYFMENSVLKQGHLYMISDIPILKDPYFGNLESALEMAYNFDYLFPQFVSVYTKKADTGYNTINYCTGGLLAYTLINAYELTKDISYLEEAEKALVTIRKVRRPHEVLYEPQELSAATAAAAKMTKYCQLLDSSTNFAKLALEFFYAQEQMVYFNGGQTQLDNFDTVSSSWLPSTWRDGLHSPYYNPREGGGINAPAFKENIESIMFWTDFIRTLYFWPDFNLKIPLSVMNLNRIKNFYFFSPNIPDEHERFYGPSTLQYIPYEDIDYYALRPGDTEADRTKAGYNGKEIYGAGETLWLYLLFEALARISDPNALIISLNVFDQEIIPENASFVTWNPYAETREFNITLTHQTEPYTISLNGSKIEHLYQPEESFNITLPPYASIYITLNDVEVPPAPYIPPAPLTTSTSTLPSQTTTSSRTSSLSLVISLGALLVITNILFRRKKHGDRS